MVGVAFICCTFVAKIKCHLEIARSVRHWAFSDQGQGHGVALKYFSIYHNTNCQGPYLSFGTC